MYLAANSKEAAAKGVHENDFGVVTSTDSVSFDSKNEVAGGIINGEAIAGEKKTSLVNSKLGFSFVDKAVVHCNSTVLHGFRI